MILDQRWFERIKPINAQLPRRLKTTSYFSTKKCFLSDTTQEPHFEYDGGASQVLSEMQASLDKLEDDLLNCSETLPAVKELYVKKIDEKRSQLNLLEVLNGAQSSDLRQESLAKAQILTEKIYGTPSIDIFSHAVNQVRERLDSDWRHLASTAAHARLKHLFPSQMVTTIENLHMPMEEGADNSDDVLYCDAEELSCKFKEALTQVGLNEWRVKINEQKTGLIQVWPRNRYVSIPNSGILKNRSNPITGSKLSGLIAHELLVHARRTERGISSGLLLLAIGLDKYWQGEEGVATYYEQKVLGAIDYAGFVPYFTIGLAYGLDRGREKRSFKEVFAVLRDYHTLDSYGKDLDPDTLAFLSCMKVFKAHHSFVLTRDCIYRAGNIAIHQLLRKNPVPDEYLNVGKYDPTNPDHVRCLCELGIIPIEYSW